MADKQRATRGATAESRKRKGKVTTEKNHEESKKKRCTSKVMCKKDRTDLMKSLQCLDPKILVNEMQRDVLEHFADGNLGKFASELFENDEPILEIARHHRESFVTLYGKCKLLKNSCMEFQRYWHAHCSAFLLEEKYKLADIDLKESDNGDSSLAGIRSVWVEFCKDHATPVPTSNPIMMTISSRAYFYLLDQVAMYQNELPMAKDKSTGEPVSNDDSDDVYYRFGGAAICTMLKHRYKEIRRCSSATRNALSIEICILQAMKIKDKSSIPGYLQYRDKGYMYFPQSSLIPFFRNFDGVLKEVVNEVGFRKHGNDLIKVAHGKINNNTDLKDEFLTELRLLLPDVEFDTISQDAMATIYVELARKLCNIRIQEFLSATKQDLAAKKGLASTVDVNLRTTLLTQHTKVSTIRLQ